MQGCAEGHRIYEGKAVFAARTDWPDRALQRLSDRKHKWKPCHAETVRNHRASFPDELHQVAVG